jgi:hypothetical protein
MRAVVRVLPGVGEAQDRIHFGVTVSRWQSLARDGGHWCAGNKSIGINALPSECGISVANWFNSIALSMDYPGVRSALSEPGDVVPSLPAIFLV